MWVQRSFASKFAQIYKHQVRRRDGKITSIWMCPPVHLVLPVLPSAPGRYELDVTLRAVPRPEYESPALELLWHAGAHVRGSFEIAGQSLQEVLSASGL
jgi:hypothetical protein